MFKKYAIALLGGSVTAAAKNYGVTTQAVSQWPDTLSAAQSAQVESAFAKLPSAKKKTNQYLAKAALPRSWNCAS